MLTRHTLEVPHLGWSARAILRVNSPREVPISFVVLEEQNESSVASESGARTK